VVGTLSDKLIRREKARKFSVTKSSQATKQTTINQQQNWKKSKINQKQNQDNHIHTNKHVIYTCKDENQDVNITED